MHRNNIVPFLFRHIENHPVPQNPGASHHNIQPPEIIHRRLHNPFPSLHRSHRLQTRHRFAPRPPDFLRHQRRHRMILAAAIHIHPRIHHHHLGPLRRQLQRNPPPNPPSRPGNHRHFVH